MMEVQSWNVRAHFQDDDGDGQGGADPETPPHVDQFGTGTSIFATGHRLEPHAANRATGRLRLPDLRMHRAGVNSAGRLRLWLALFLCQKPLRLFGELGSAAGRTEMIEVSGIGVIVRRFRRIDPHPADRVDFSGRWCRMAHDR